MPSYQDLVNAYQSIDPSKVTDLGRILASVGGTGGNYSLQQLQGIGAGPNNTGLSGLSNRSMGDWQNVLGVLSSSATPTMSGFEMPTMNAAAGGTSATGLGATPIGNQQTLLNDWFKQASLGGGKIPGASTLFNLSQGKIPPAILQNFQNQLDWQNANTTEMFGKVGNRFGTDLAQTISRQSNQAITALNAQAMDRALSAIGQILGTGSTTAGFEFTGTQNALNRALQDYLMQQQTYASLIPYLLGAA